MTEIKASGMSDYCWILIREDPTDKKRKVQAEAHHKVQMEYIVEIQ